MIFGALLALGSAFSFSVNSILVRRGFADAGATAVQGAFITVLLGVPFGLVAVVVTGQLLNFGQVPLNGYLLVAAAGVVHFCIGRYCNYRSIAAIGASRTVTIQAIAVPYSIVMAIVLLGERPTVPMYLADRSLSQAVIGNRPQVQARLQLENLDPEMAVGLSVNGHRLEAEERVQDEIRYSISPTQLRTGYNHFRIFVPAGPAPRLKDILVSVLY